LSSIAGCCIVGWVNIDMQGHCTTLQGKEYKSYYDPIMSFQFYAIITEASGKHHQTLSSQQSHQDNHSADNSCFVHDLFLSNQLSRRQIKNRNSMTIKSFKQYKPNNQYHHFQVRITLTYSLSNSFGITDNLLCQKYDDSDLICEALPSRRSSYDEYIDQIIIMGDGAGLRRNHSNQIMSLKYIYLFLHYVL